MSQLITPKIIQIGDNEYLINSFNPKKPSEQYKVSIIRDLRTGIPLLGKCECPHHTFRLAQCKHIVKVMEEISK